MARKSPFDPSIHRPRTGDGSLPICDYCTNKKKGCYYAKNAFTCDQCDDRPGQQCSTQRYEDSANTQAAIGLAGSSGKSVLAEDSADGLSETASPAASSSTATSSTSSARSSSEDEGPRGAGKNIDSDINPVAGNESDLAQSESPFGAPRADDSGYNKDRIQFLTNRMSRRGALGTPGVSGDNVSHGQGQANSGTSSSGSVRLPLSIMEKFPLDFGAGRGPIPPIQPESQPNSTDRPNIICCNWAILNNRNEEDNERYRMFVKFYSRIRARRPDFCLKGLKRKHKEGEKSVYARFDHLFILSPTKGESRVRVFGTNDLINGEITELFLRDHAQICFESNVKDMARDEELLVEYLGFYAGCTVPGYGPDHLHIPQLRISYAKYRAAGETYVSPLPSMPEVSEAPISSSYRSGQFLSDAELEALFG